MPYTLVDFERDYVKKHFPKLTLEEQQEVLNLLAPEKRLSGLAPEEIQKYLDKLTASARPSASRKQHKKK